MTRAAERDVVGAARTLRRKLPAGLPDLARWRAKKAELARLRRLEAEAIERGDPMQRRSTAAAAIAEHGPFRDPTGRY